MQSCSHQADIYLRHQIPLGYATVPLPTTSFNRAREDLP